MKIQLSIYSVDKREAADDFENVSGFKDKKTWFILRVFGQSLG